MPPPPPHLHGSRRGPAALFGVLIVAILVVGAGLLVVRNVLSRNATGIATASAVPSLAPGTVVPVTITPGESSADLARDLQNKGLVPSEVVFLGVVKLRGTASGFQPGTHQIAAGTPVEDIIAQLQAPAPPNQIRVTFPEGRRLEEDAQTAAKAGIGTEQDFLQLAQHPDPSWSYTFLADLPKNATLEGYLFPDTFLIAGDSPKASDLIKKMLDDFDKRVTPAMRQQVTDQKRTLYDTLIIASIVEREAKVPDERPLIAGVYWNRIDSKQGLFADPTVQYALGTPANWWPKLPNTPLASVAPSSPYNTYSHNGLPPGPIANPGLASIQAAIAPQGNYLYFVAKNDGSGAHAFSKTQAEQNANIAKYSN